MSEKMFPGRHDWRFDNVEQKRARALDDVIAPSALTQQLAEGIEAGIKHTARYGLDRDKKNGTPRIIIQIPVSHELFDQFYNGRCGYRAHYWVRPEVGNDFDNSLVCLV